jgi:hypothetical protein
MIPFQCPAVFDKKKFAMQCKFLVTFNFFLLKCENKLKHALMIMLHSLKVSLK